MAFRLLRPVLVPFIALFCAATGHAQDDYARLGPYAGIGFIGAIEVFPGAPSGLIDNSVGVNVEGGFRLHPNFAAEIDYEFVEGFNIEGTSAEIEIWVLTVNAKAILATGQLQPYLLVGLGVMNADLEVDGVSVLDEEGEDFVVRFGAGLDFFISRHVGLYGEFGYVVPTDSVDNLDYLSLGIGARYHF